MMQPQVVIQPQVVVRPATATAFVVPAVGWLRLHIQNAHLEINRGGPLDKMDPFVYIKVGNRQEWRSQVCINGGKNPQWHHQHMDIPVKKLKKLGKNVHIEVRDQDPLKSEPLGHTNITLGLFAKNGPREERI